MTILRFPRAATLRPYWPQEQELASGEETSSGEEDTDEEGPISAPGADTRSIADGPLAGVAAQEGSHGKALQGDLTSSLSSFAISPHACAPMPELLCMERDLQSD